MRKLYFRVTYDELLKKNDILVPRIFTKYQFELILKKIQLKKLSNSQNSYFSRSISKKLIALDIISDNFYFYGEELLISERIDKAKQILSNLKRKFKDKIMFISGSFLYSKNYADIDVFVVSKYEKDDFKIKNISINYISESFFDTILFQSVKQCAVSTHSLDYSLKEDITLSDYIRTYEQVFFDVFKKNDYKDTLRNFLLSSYYMKTNVIPSSKEIYFEYQKFGKENILKIINYEFMSVILRSMDGSLKEIIKKKIIQFEDLKKEFSNQRKYYDLLLETLRGVIDVGM
ncbi:MAG: hypothetical protein WC755_04955 [Candidatus Woesearchaeota archaeon]|jgi:hypothetical protein